MPASDPQLVVEAERFAEEISDLLQRTVCDDPPIQALTAGGRLLVAPFGEDGERCDIPLQIAGETRLGLRIEFLCNWDFTGKFLAIEKSEFAVKVAHLNEPLIRFDYLHGHSWAPAHVQVHAESSALGYLFAFTPIMKPPKVQALHLPVGGRRFRPCLEDVIDFVIHDFAVEAKPGAAERIRRGRATWRSLQVKAAIRDVIKNDPDGAPAELHATIDQAIQDVRNAK